MDIYEEHLRMWLFEEQRPVSYSYLGFEISVSSNTAKQCVLLFLFSCSTSDQWHVCSLSTPNENTYLLPTLFLSFSECCGNLQPISLCAICTDYLGESNFKLL